MAMDWPDMAADGIRAIPEVHRVNGWYVGLGLLVVVVLTYARKVLRGLDPRPMPASVTLDDVQSAVEHGIRGAINGHLIHLREGQDRLSAEIREIRERHDKRHEENIDRLARIETRLDWTGEERRRASDRQQHPR